MMYNGKLSIRLVHKNPTAEMMELLDGDVEEVSTWWLVQIKEESQSRGLIYA